MSISKDIEAFYDWATKTGCPQKCLPSEDALKSIFKSRSRDLFAKLMIKVQPIKDVEEVRENILIRTLEKFENKAIPTAGRSLLPMKIQNYLKINEMLSRKGGLEIQLGDLVKEAETSFSNYETKIIKLKTLKKKRDNLRMKVLILQKKLIALNSDINKEKENKVKILEVMPVQVTMKNVREQRALEAVQEALNELGEFYKECSKGLSASDLRECRDNLWKKIRNIFHDIPNLLIYNIVMRLKDEQLQYIINLKKPKNHNDSSFKVSKETLTQFEEKLMETKIETLSILAQYVAAREEHEAIELKFSNHYHPFVENLRRKMMLFNSADSDEEQMDEIISEYIVQYNKCNFFKAQNDFFSQQIEFYKLELERGKKYLESHEQLLQSIKEMYTQISDSVNHIQYETMQLSQIKDKILHCKHLMQQKIQAIQRKNLNKLKKNDISISLLSNDGFELGNESLFSSTKVDFDASINPLINLTVNNRSFSNQTDLTVIPSNSSKAAANNNMLPPCVIELSTFLDTPLEKFNRLPKECALHLLPNPLIWETSEYPTSVLKLAPGIILTASAALHEVQRNINWAELIARHSNELKFDLEITPVDLNALKEKRKKQDDEILELLERIDVSCVTTNRILQKIKKLYDFILENPLRHHIPPTKLFCNQPYANYEAEFMMYYRIASAASSPN